MPPMPLGKSDLVRSLWRPCRRALAAPRVNPVATALLRPFAARLPAHLLLHCPVAKTVRVTSPVSGRPILLDNLDAGDPVASLLYWRGLQGWEPETTAVYLSLLRPDSTVLDIGAHTGLFSLLAADVDQSIHVHAFEPVARIFARLHHNAQLNAFSNLTCHQAAVLDRPGEISLYIPEEQMTVVASVLPTWADGSASAFTVHAETVDDFLSHTTPSPVSLIKIDVEGAEYAVLRGAARTLAAHRPSVICEILDSSDNCDEVFRFFHDQDYCSYHLTASGLRAFPFQVPVDPAYKNYLFLPRDRRHEVENLVPLCPSGAT